MELPRELQQTKPGFMSTVVDTPEGPAVFFACSLAPEYIEPVSTQILKVRLRMDLQKRKTAALLHFSILLDTELPLVLDTYLNIEDTNTENLIQLMSERGFYYLGFASLDKPEQTASIKKVRVSQEFENSMGSILRTAKRYNENIPNGKRDFEAARRDAIGN